MASPEVKIKISADGSQAATQLGAIQSGIERSAAASEKLTAALARMGHYTAAAFSVGSISQYAAQVVKTADAWQQMAGRLNVVTGSTQAAAAAQQQLFLLAQSMRSPLEETTTLYTRLVPALKEMGKTSGEALAVTEAMGLALKISGATTQESASAMLQFSQAMASGVLRGEEFNALNEASPRLMKAFADSMGVPIGSLKKLAEEGKLTATSLTRALTGALPQLRDEYAKIPATVADAFTRLKNESAKAIGEFNQQVKGTERLAGAINSLSQNLKTLGVIAEGAGAIMVGRMVATTAATAAATASTAALALAARSAAAEMGLVVAATSGLGATLARMSVAAKGGWIGLLLFGGYELADYFGWLDGIKKKLGEVKTSLFGDANDKLALMVQKRNELEDKLFARRKGARTYKDVMDVKAAEESLAVMDKEIDRLKQVVQAETAAKEARARAAREKSAEAERENNRFSQMSQAREPQDKSAQEKLMQGRGDWRALAKKKEAELKAEEDVFRQATVGVGNATAEYAAMLEAHNERIKKIKEKYEKKDERSSKEPDAAAARFLANIRERIAALESQGSAEDRLTEGQKLRLKLEGDIGAGLLKMDSATRRLSEAELDRLDQLERARATLLSLKESGEKHVQQLANEEKAARDAAEAARLEYEQLGLSQTQIAELALARLEDARATNLQFQAQYGKNQADQDELESIDRRIESTKELIAWRRKSEGKQANIDAAKDALKKQEEAARAAQAEWQKTVDRIDQTFHDGFVGMLEKGKADWESFADSIANTFKTAVADEIYKMTIRPMVVQVVGAFSGQPGAAGQAQGFGGVLSNLQSAYAGVTGGISNAANSFAMSGMGQWAGLSTAAKVTPTSFGSMVEPAALTGAGSSFVAAAAPVAAAAASAAVIDGLQRAGWGPDNNLRGYLSGMAPGMVMSGSGLSNGLTSGLSGVNAALFSASAVGTLGASIVADRLFGRNRNISNDAAGIRGTFDLTGFSGEQYQERSQKGGTFRSDKRWTDPIAIASDMDAALDSMLKQTVSGLQAIGKTLNVESVKALEGFSHEFQLQLTENGDWSKASEKIAAEVAKVSDELVTRLVPNIADLSRYGESASQAFERLNQEVQATDAILLAMGKSAAEAFGGVGLASIAAREHLIDLAGGLESLAGKTQFFYANFYSQSEQLQLAGKQAKAALDAGFSELGLSIPTTREAFRSLVESQDLSTDAGRKLFNGLLDLADEFKAVADAADDAGTGSKKIAEVAKQASEQATGQLASIFDTFASDTQKLDAAKKLVSETFASIGKSVPENAAAFLALAQSIDPATEAGQGLIAALAKVSNAFAYTQTAAITAAEAATAAINKARNTSAQAFFQQIDFRSAADGYVNDGQAAIDKLFGNINAGAIESAQLAASAAADASQAWKSASQSIKSALDNIRTGSLSGLSPESRYRMLQSQFAATSAAAQSGDKEAAGKLGQIATDFLEASRDYNASSEAFQADRAAADTALSKSLSYASSQVSLQDTIAKASQASVTHLQSLNDTLTGFSAKALELLQKGYAGADRGTASNAVSALSSLQAVADKFFADTTAGFTQQYAGGTLMRLEGSNAQFTDAAGKTSYVRAGESVLDIAKRVDALRDFWSKQFGLNLPSYAVGTPFVPEDQIAQIHQGEMIIPASAAAQLRKYGIGSQPDNGLQAEILAELRTTRQSQQQSYGAMQQQLASSNAKLAAVERRLAAMEDQARLQRAGS